MRPEGKRERSDYLSILPIRPSPSLPTSSPVDRRVQRHFFQRGQTRWFCRREGEEGEIPLCRTKCYTLVPLQRGVAFFGRTLPKGKERRQKEPQFPFQRKGTFPVPVLQETFSHSFIIYSALRLVFFAPSSGVLGQTLLQL